MSRTCFDPVSLLMVFGTRPASPVKVQKKSPIRHWVIPVKSCVLSMEKRDPIEEVYRFKKKAPHRRKPVWSLKCRGRNRGPPYDQGLERQHAVTRVRNVCDVPDNRAVVDHHNHTQLRVRRQKERLPSEL